MTAPHSTPVGALVDHLFRERAGQMVATLTRILGVANLQLAEDVVQEALLKALRVWSFRGVPSKPDAWLFATARNAAIDAIRRDASLAEKTPEILAWSERAAAAAAGQADATFDDELSDDQLRLMFACCHPSLPRNAQVALTLKSLCGFGVDEIARAFLTPSATIAQRLVRAKRRLRDDGVTISAPRPAEIATRLDPVLDVLYVMFNEAHVAHSGSALVRDDLMRETIRLVRLLLHRADTAEPRVEALLALMLLQGARLPARTDGDGNLVLLQHQDRSRWDVPMIAEGLTFLVRSARGEERSAFHIQAAIAACHSTASSWEATDWPAILVEYDRLMSLRASPIVALNRTVALALVEGPAAALRALDALDDEASLSSYYLYSALRAEFLMQTGQLDEAAGWLERALTLPCSEPERRFMLTKLARCRDARD